VLGVSADSPFPRGEFRDEHGIEFDLVSDTSRDVVLAYDPAIDLPDLGPHGVTNRAVFVLDGDGTVRYRRVAADPTTEPPYDAVLEAVESPPRATGRRPAAPRVSADEDVRLRQVEQALEARVRAVLVEVPVHAPRAAVDERDREVPEFEVDAVAEPAEERPVLRRDRLVRPGDGAVAARSLRSVR
jgi:hypothetical protein